MFEGIVADLLNKHLGKYVQNLDTENLKVGIFSGTVELTDLQLKPEALFELDLPIEVKAGYIGRIHIDIPWSSIYSSPVEAVLDDVYVLVGPVQDRKYDPERERALADARKRKRLDNLETTTITDDGETRSQDPGFLERIAATIINNIEVSIQRIHIRYEDKFTTPDHPFACGIMLKTLTAQTTNGQWQPVQVDATANSIHKLVRLHGLSLYWNPYVPEQSLVRGKVHTSSWRNLLKNAINTHRIMEEELDFLLRPITANVKSQYNREVTDLMLPKLLVDFAMDEIEILTSRQQFLNMLGVVDSFRMMEVNQRYRKYSPDVPLKGHAAAWWHYAYTAVVGEYIRPYSWKSIKQHRSNYKRYVVMYKQLLSNSKSNNIKNQLRELEYQLDVANIVLAREHAKFEFASEAPNKPKSKAPEQGWWGRMWGGETESESETEEGETGPPVGVGTGATPASLPEWLNTLSPEEQEKLFNNIGYDRNKNEDHAPQYVAHKFLFNLALCSVSLVNYGKEVLKCSITQLNTCLEHRPEPAGFRAGFKAESFIVEGVSVERELVPIITSDIGVYAPSHIAQVFSLEIEKNPVHIEADFATRINIQPVEIVYDEHAVTEVIAFFHMPHISAEDVRTMAQSGLSRIATISRASMQYAIQQHQTIHVSVNMRSPYVVIPEYGTLHRGGNVLVVDFGKLKVESELQPKLMNLDDLTMSEIESRLYDKFNITVTEVKALLADSAEDWHTAQTKPDSHFHILPSTALQIALFNTVKPDYDQLPRHKIEAKLTTLKVHMSDEKLTVLSDFCKHMPMPHSNSMMGLDDSVDGHLVEPVSPIMDDKEVQLEPTLRELRHMRRSVHRNSIVRRKPGDRTNSTRESAISTESDKYYSASDHSDEEVDEWAKGPDLPPVEDHSSPSNLVQILGRFVLGEAVVQLSKCADQIDTPYLMFRMNRVRTDIAWTVYGMAAQASLGGIQLVDKIHLGSSGEYLELLGSKSETDLINVKYRKVDASCPDADATYRNTRTAMLIHINSLRLQLDRTAILYLNTFLQGLLINVHGGMESNLRRSTSTIMSTPQTEPSHPDPPGFIDRLTPKDEGASSASIKLHLVATFDDLEIKLCDQENDFAVVQVKGLESRLLMKAKKTTFQARLSDFSIEDMTENTLYTKVLTIEDDNAFDFKMVTYETHTKTGADKVTSVDGSIKLRLGRVHGVFLYKFITEIQNFLEPFTSRELFDSYRMAAMQAAHTKIQDVQEQGQRYSLYLDIRAPTILVPQHSESTNVMVLKLGDFTLRNFFEDSEVGGPGVLQHWDHMYLRLDALQVVRGKLNLNGNVDHATTLVDPINLKIDLKRGLPPYRSDLHYDVSGELKCIDIHVTQLDMKVLMAVLSDNMNEESTKPSPVDQADLTPMTDRPIMHLNSLEATTPVVEIEEPLLSAPEVLELINQTKFTFVLEGVVLTLLTEPDHDHDPSHDPDLQPDHLAGNDEGDGLSRFEIGELSISGLLNNEGALEIQLALQSVLLKDIRESSNLAVKRMVQSTFMAYPRPDTTPPMVVLDYKYTPHGNKQLDVTVDTLRINLCLPYLLMVLHFFTDALKTPEEMSLGSSSPQPPGGVPREPAAPPPVPSPRLPRSAQPPSEAIKILGKFKRLEVVLFAEPSNKHSQVLVLKAHGSCDYVCLQDREHLEAKIKQLQIVSCQYSMANQTASMLLYPCDLELTRSKESADSELKMDVKLSDVRLHVSVTTLHIALDVLDIINQNGAQPQAADTHDVSLGSTQHYDLWTTRSISAERWLQPEPEEVNNKYPICPAGPPIESLHVDLANVQVMFEVENLDYHVPRLCVKAGAQADLHDWSKQLRAQGELRLDVSYYNDKLAVWEPLLEPIMEAENNYRPWEVLVKLVRAQSHPISCVQIDYNVRKDDDLDGEVHYLMRRSRVHSDSSETETDSETEMTIIKPKLPHKARAGSHSSYDSVSHHSSIQGESDSEPELISTLSSNLDSMFSSDSSEADVSEGDDDAFESSDKPVFLTARGPVHVDHELESGYDEVDGPFEEDVTASLCTYLLIDSHDQLVINLTPKAMDIITEVSETLMRSNTAALKSIHDLPGFEIYNELQVGATVSLSHDLQDISVDHHWAPRGPDPLVFIQTPEVFEDNFHNIALASRPSVRTAAEREEPPQKLIDVESVEDEVDGLSFLTKALASTAHTLVSSAAFVFPEDDEEGRYGNSKELGKEKMHIKLDGFDEIYNVSHQKAVAKLIPLAPSKNDTSYHMMYHVDIQHGRKFISLRSPLQLFNHLAVPIEVCCLTEDLHKCGATVAGPQRGEYTQIKVLEAEQRYDVPLFVAYHCKLYAAPLQAGYNVNTNAIWWQDLSVTKDRFKFFSCEHQEPGQRPFFFKVVCEEGKVQSPRSHCLQKVTPCYVLHLHATVILHNYLPYDIQFSLERSPASALAQGDRIALPTADLSRAPTLNIQVIDYLGLDWAGTIDLTNDLEEFKAITMEPDANTEGLNKQLTLGIHVKRTTTLNLYVYSPYWIINKTGLPVHIRGSRSEAVYNNDTGSDPLLFRFKKHRRKKAKLKVYNSKWTASFSLDTIGSNGVVICHDRERNCKYQFLLQIQMSKLRLTKIVTILPYFLVINNTPHRVRYMEENEQADLWLDIAPQECIPFWPSTDSMKMYVKYQDSLLCSQHFHIHRPHITTLRMEKGTAMCVEVAGGMEGSTTITFVPYEHGDAPVKIENFCEDVFIKLHQKNQSQVSLLSPNQSVLYTWDDPTAERTLMWNVYNRKKPSYPAFISKDGFGEVQLSIQTMRGSGTPQQTNDKKKNKTEAGSQAERRQHRDDDSSPDDDSEAESAPVQAPLLHNTRTDKVVVYWVSFMDGLQRVIIFAQDERIARRARKVMEAEQATLALFVSLAGISVSLINGVYEEVAFMSLSCGASLWEVEVKNKWKTLNMELASLLEEQWMRQEEKVTLEDFLDADLVKMVMKRPFIGALRRVYNPALWLQYRRSKHHTYIHTRIHRLQLDNQLKDAYFPTVFYPSPQPTFLVKRSGPKPFVEFALMRRHAPEINVDTFKYVKLLMQEFSINVDKGFVMSVYDMFANKYQETESEQLNADMSQIHRSLRESAASAAGGRPRRLLFEYLHLSPLKMRINFSLDGRPHLVNIPKDTSLTSDIVDFFLNSVGATLTEIRDVELRMAFFERQGVMLSYDQLMRQVVSHYKSQAIQQAYVLVLGLDVLGNPYGLIKDFTQGLGDFFYEPVMSSIDSPDRFGEHLVKGVQSLMEHTVGSVAGSLSGITGSLGRTLAFLSFDKDYKKRRHHHMMQQPRNLPQSLYLAGKGFVMGVALGLSGIVMSPLRGVQEEGVEGFFKGIGKGLMGLLTKPTGGAVDMVGMAFDGIRRAAEMGEAVVVRMRPPRFINPSHGLRPFSRYQAVGMRIMNNIDKGRYANSDIYWAHAALSKEERADVAMVTDKRILLLEKCRIWGDWDLEWEVLLGDIIGVPGITHDRLVIKVKRTDSDFSIFTSDEREIVCQDPQVLQWFQRKIEKVIAFGK